MTEPVNNYLDTEIVNLYYAEHIGPNPIKPTGTTEEYKVLNRVTRREAIAYMDRFNWIRAKWRIEPL